MALHIFFFSSGGFERGEFKCAPGCFCHGESREEGKVPPPSPGNFSASAMSLTLSLSCSIPVEKG